MSIKFIKGPPAYSHGSVLGAIEADENIPKTPPPSGPGWGEPLEGKQDSTGTGLGLGTGQALVDSFNKQRQGRQASSSFEPIVRPPKQGKGS